MNHRSVPHPLESGHHRANRAKRLNRRGSVVLAALTVLAGLGVAAPTRAEALTSRDFSVSASPRDLTLQAGQSASFRVSVRRGSKFRSALRFAVDNPFVGVTATPVGASSRGAGVNVLVSPTAPGQTGQLRVVVTGGGRTHIASVNLLVNGAAPVATTPPPPPASTVPAVVGDFAIALDPPAQFTINAGASATVGVFVNPVNGYTGAPRFELVGLPAGVIGNFVNPSSRSGTNLILTAASSAARGIYPITVRAVDGDKVRIASTVMTIRVLGDFAIAAAFDANRAVPGSPAQLKVTLGLAAGFVQIPDVDITVNGLPPGSIVSPTTIRTSSTATLSVTFPAGTAEGNYSVNVRGESGSIIRTAVTIVLVSAKPLVSLTPASLSIAKGGQATYEILYTAVPGIGTPALSTPAPPAGLTYSITTNLDGRRFLEVKTTAATAAATYTIPVTATSGAAAITVNAQLVVS